MPPSLGTGLHVVFLVALGCLLVTALSMHWPELKRDFLSGIHPSSGGGAAGQTRFTDSIGGVEVSHDPDVSLALSPLAVALVKEEPARVVMATPVFLDRPVDPAALLREIGQGWAGGVRKLGHQFNPGQIHDEGGSAWSALDATVEGESLAGEMKVLRDGRDLRFEAFWVTKEDFDKERASMEAQASTIRFFPGAPLGIRTGARYSAAVPPDFEFHEDPGGVQLTARSCDRVAFGLTVAAPWTRVSQPQQLIELYLSNSKGLTDPTTGTLRSYPSFDDAAGNRWNIAGRELSYHIFGEPVRAVLTAAIVQSGERSAHVMAVRQAPPEDWDRWALTL
ncbi:MAG: hypothetical protein HY815_30480, partial [Candidatus Riflebacteria bacterium]|nr:hypothetical protein [Candidatus Riflebacteria bacterium]